MVHRLQGGDEEEHERLLNALSYWQQLDLLLSQWKEQHPTAAELKKRARKLAQENPAPKAPRTPMTITEMMIVDKLQSQVTFPPATGPKRFIHRLNMDSTLSDAGRQYLAYVAHRFRRQWRPTQEEFEWIVRWKGY